MYTFFQQKSMDFDIYFHHENKIRGEIPALSLVENMFDIQMETEAKEKHIINTSMYAYSCKEIA